MANGFKLIGGSYVAKWGNNSWAGTSESTPKQTINAGHAVGTGDLIVLAGVYVEAVSARKILADGIVKIKGNLANSGDVGAFSDGLIIENFLNWSAYGLLNTTFRNIVGTITNYTNGGAYTGCRFINVNSMVSGFGMTVARNIFFNCGDIRFYGYDSNYFDLSCNIVYAGNPGFTNCNMRGKFTRTGATLPGVYCVPTGSDITISVGTATVVSFASRTGSYPSGCTDWLHVGLGLSATECYVTNGNFNADPQFVDVFNEDFSVLPTSPMIGKATGGLNIGGVKVTDTSLRKTATQFTSKTNLSGTSDLSVEPSNVTGEWISEVITIDALNPRVFQRPTYVGNLSFDASSVGNVANVNDNVPWVPTYVKNGVTINNQTNKQLRPCFLVRFSNKNSMPNPAVDSDWDNGNNNTTTVNGVLPGEYFLAELNADFKYDANGFGNADVNFNPVVNSQIAAKYCMYRVILTDNYPNVW